MLLTLSKWLHKYLGLIFLLILIFMSVTGILINHPQLIANFSVPVGILGKSYEYSNWNRFLMRDGLILSDGSIIIGGKSGVFIDKNKGSSFEPINDGLPESLFFRDTRCLLAVGEGDNTRLFAGTRAGLFYKNINDKKWQPASFEGKKDEIVDLALADNKILAFTPFGCLSAPVNQEKPVFNRSSINIPIKEKNLPAYRLLLELHSGKIFGLSGRIFIDIVSLILIFLCVSGLYLWYIPWSRRRFRFASRKNQLFSFMYRHHLKFGIWSAIFFILIAFTGTFVRPPFISFIDFWKVPAYWIHQGRSEIHKAVVLDDGNIIIASNNGWFKVDSSFKEPFTEINPPFSVAGMGVTALKKLEGNRLIAGSFSGLYILDLNSGTAEDISGKQREKNSSVRQSKLMVAGALVNNGELTGYADYRKGFVGYKNNNKIKFSEPDGLYKESMSLYHFLFELHNGRFLRDLLGKSYIFFIPVVGFGFLLIVVTGVYDWYRRKRSLLRK